MTTLTKLKVLEDLYRRADVEWHNALVIAIDVHATTGLSFSVEADMATEALNNAEATYDKWQSALTRVEG